jgi:transcriptional regulator with XRE-family HTH domain
MLSDFGKELRKLRIEKSLTLADLSEELRCSVAYVSALERGIKMPSTAMVQEIGEKMALSNAQVVALSMSAQRSRGRIDLSNLDDGQIKLLSTLSHKAASLESEVASILEEAIRDDDTRRRIIRYAKRLVEKKRQQPEFDFGVRARAAGLKRPMGARRGDMTGSKVPAMTLAELRTLADGARGAIGLGAGMPFDPIRFLDFGLLDRVCPGFDYRVLNAEDFTAALARDEDMTPERPCAVDAFVEPLQRDIVIPNRLYLAAASASYSPVAAKARFTLTHEIAHAMLHKNIIAPDPLRPEDLPEVSSEWQADELAHHILLSPSSVACFETDEAMANGLFVTRQSVSIQRGRYRAPAPRGR